MEEVLLATSVRIGSKRHNPNRKLLGDEGVGESDQPEERKVAKRTEKQKANKKLC